MTKDNVQHEITNTMYVIEITNIPRIGIAINFVNP